MVEYYENGALENADEDIYYYYDSVDDFNSNRLNGYKFLLIIDGYNVIFKANNPNDDSSNDDELIIREWFVDEGKQINDIVYSVRKWLSVDRHLNNFDD